MPTREQQIEWGKQGALKQWNGISREERFWSKVKKGNPNECWPWLRATITRVKCKYGIFSWCHGHNRLAHRVAYEFLVGPIPEGAELCHSCDNGICCNPSHLWPGTHLENMQDMSKKGRHVGTTGKKNVIKRGSKYSKEFVLKLQSEHVPWKVTPKMLAKKYGITEGSIRALLWRSEYITEPNWKWP